MPEETGKVYLQWWINTAGVGAGRTAHLSLEDAIKFPDQVKKTWRLRPCLSIWSQKANKKQLKMLEKLLRGRKGVRVTNAQLPWRLDRTNEAHVIYYRYWHAKSGGAFTTLHVSKETAEEFAKEQSSRWKSTPSENLLRRMIPWTQFEKICDAIGAGSGVKAWLDDFK